MSSAPSGLSEAAARRQALVELGGLDQVKERVRDVRAGAVLDQIRQDLLYAVRLLRKNLGFTVVAVTTLAIGIGATTAIFSVVDTVVFRPLPYHEPDRLVKICGTGPRDRACDDDFSLREFESIRERSDIFEQVAADDGMGVSVVRADGSREPLGVGLVSPNWLGALGVPAGARTRLLGGRRAAGRDRVVILTYDYWRRHRNSDPLAIGQTIAFDGITHTVVGVLPPNVLRSYADVLKPFVAAGYSDRSLDVFGRLKPGMSLAQARAGMELLGARLEQEYPETNRGRRLSARPLGKDYAAVDAESSNSLVLMLGAVGDRAPDRVRERRQPAAGACRPSP